MIGRLTLAKRLALLVTVLLIALWILSISLYLRNQARIYFALDPDPDRLGAIVALFDAAAPDAYPGLIEALASERLQLSVTARAEARLPPEAEHDAGETRNRYAAVLGERLRDFGTLEADGFVVKLPRLLGKGRAGFAFVIALRDGAALNVVSINPLVFTRFGFPIGFGAGLFGTGVAILALLVMQRETRPLRRLAAAVDDVDFQQAPVPLPDARGSAPEIRAVIAAFNRLQERLHVVMRARMALVGGISHDVRTFATRLRLRVDGIADPAERQRAEADISDMIRLLDDALVASRAGAGGLDQELVEIAALVAGEVDDRRRHAAPVSLSLEGDAREAAVIGDRLALRRIVSNLVDNALKYGARADVTLRTAPASVAILVDDFGPGIPEAQRALMLEPFSRLEGSRNRATGGAGLGLAIARALVLAHGGTLEIGRSPSAGARISVTLPRFLARG